MDCTVSVLEKSKVRSNGYIYTRRQSKGPGSCVQSCFGAVLEDDGSVDVSLLPDSIFSVNVSLAGHQRLQRFLFGGMKFMFTSQF